MKTQFVCAFVVLVCLPVLSASAGEIAVVAPAAVGLSEEKLDDVDRFMEGQVADQKIAGGIVLIARHGQVGLFRAYGRMDVEADKPMQPDTIFRLYSMTKAVTTAAALTLIDAGKLSLDDPVAEHIPCFASVQVAAADGLRPPARPMTVRDLMLHTAGLTYGGGPEASREAFSAEGPLQAPDLEAMCERLARVPLAFDPGTDWMYSTSIDVLGRVVEVASGQRLDEYLRATLFEPLEMTDTAFSVPSEKLSRFAANYGRSDEGLRLIDAPAESAYAREATLLSGGGGLVGTAGDYLRFLTMIQRGGELNGRRVLQPETVALMTSDQLPEEAFPIYFGEEVRRGTGFGLGFSVRTEITDWDPAGHVGEYGWGGAASTHYWCSPADELIVITLEQIMPYQWDTEFGVKKFIYEAVVE